MSSAEVGPNAEQAKYWTETGGPSWVRDEVVFDTMLEPFNVVLVEALSPTPGEKVLDVGCGFGTTSLAVASRGAVVHGVDVSPPMIDRARERARAAAWSTTFAVLDAQEDSLVGPYDAVTSRFGVMFFADPVRAFENFARSTRSGGRLVFVCWQTLDRNPWMSHATDVVRGLLADPPPPAPAAAGPFAFGDPVFVERVLRAAGWRDNSLTPVERDVQMGGNGGVQGAVDQALGMSAVSALFALGDDTLRDRAAEELRSRFERHTVGGVVRFPAAVWLVQARPR